MAYNFFYISTVGMWILLGISTYFKRMELKHLVIGISTVAFSLAFDTLFGEYFGLYHYISPDDSLVYIILAALFLYPAANVIYTLFLPREKRRIMGYTLAWLAGMLIFEYLSVLTGTVVFTGWNPIPWSPLVYVVTYSWVYLLYSVLDHQGRLRPTR